MLLPSYSLRSFVLFIEAFEPISSDCKSAARCSKCGQKKHEKPEDCPCHQLPPRCCNCGQELFLRSVLCILSKDKISICCPGECVLCESSWQAEIFSSFLNDFLSFSSSPSFRSFYAIPHRKPLPSYHNVNSYEILGLIPEFGPASSYNIRQFYSDRDRFPSSGNTVSQHNIFYCQTKQFFNPSLGDHINLFKTYLVKHTNSVLSLLMANRRTLTPRHSPALGEPPHLFHLSPPLLFFSHPLFTSNLLDHNPISNLLNLINVNLININSITSY